jgi:putative aminopeptidase FrvX
MFIRVFLIVAGLLWCNSLAAQSLPERFLELVQAQGVAGYEADVREAVQRQLPAWVRPRVDETGNLIVTLGTGQPHIALVANLDEGGYVVSRITDDGFLRLHRHTTGASHRLGDQFVVGQPVIVRTSGGRMVSGVTATPSTHLRGLVDPAETARLKSVQDLWVDVGAAGPAEVAQLGIRLLDPVSLRERAQPLANGRVAGVASQQRAGAQVLIETLRGLPGSPAVSGTLTVAWVTQSQFGSRGLARLAQTIRPDRVYLVGRPAAREPPPPAGWEKATIEAKSVPALFMETPVEVVDTRDITSLALALAAAAGLKSSTAAADGTGAQSRALATRVAEPSSPSFALLKTLIESYGVSGHEAPVREAVLGLLPSWAKPQVDEKGNVTVSFGSGGKELVFVAHMDEVGFEISGIRDDGSATVRARGGMYLSLYEAHPVLAHTPAGRVPAIVAPRGGYAAAATSQPDADALFVYFGTTSAAGTRALGVAEGQAISIRKEFVELAAPRATGRSMDDRAGSSALILALRQIDPKSVTNRVTFAWSVEEETGLAGAGVLAARLRPQYAFAVDTFVSTETPVDVQHLAYAKLGAGAVLRGMDSRTVAPPETIDRIVSLARQAGVPLQIGVTLGGTDASTFSSRGAIDVGLSWPGRYSHSPVEVIDRRDLESLARLIATLAERF